MEKVKIVLDADVIIHFSKAGRLSILPDILPEYDYIVLDYVRDELRGDAKEQMDKMEAWMKKIKTIPFVPHGEMMREYILLNETKGKGESACMAYCRFTNNVIGSSNLKDIKDYCILNKIAYLTTTDFLYYAYTRKILTKKDCEDFVSAVLTKGSRIPKIDITTYTPNTLI